MPDYCICRLYIEGAVDSVDAFLSHIRNEDTILDFEKIISYPEHFAKADRAAAEWNEVQERSDNSISSIQERPKSGYENGGLGWRLQSWGTKWNAIDPVFFGAPKVSSKRKRVCIDFATAWDPPLPLIEHASKLFPLLSLELRYHRGVDEMQGVFICEQGNVSAFEKDDADTRPKRRLFFRKKLDRKSFASVSEAKKRYENYRADLTLILDEIRSLVSRQDKNSKLAM